jgi:uncharacterized protein with HEPN domain
MERDSNTYLYDIVQGCHTIRTFTRHIDFARYTTDLLVKSAVERQFIIIGEALSRLKRFDVTVYNQIPHADQIVAFRHILVHGYDIISDQLVWQAIQFSLTELLENCNNLLGDWPTSM